MLQTDTAGINLDVVKRDIDEQLADFFTKHIALAQPLGLSYVRLWQTMQHLGQAGGKRLRPYMVMLGHHSFGGKPTDDIIPVATAWELLHLCMLIHDDIIDNDLVRYNVSNIAGSYQTFYEPLEADRTRRNHLAMSAAILAGDLAHSGAHEIIIGSRLTAEQKILAQQYLTAATFSVAGGELLDTESVLYDMTTVDALSIARFKTASYSFVGPLCTGAALAGADEQQLDNLQRYGIALGCAFQLTDDLLGVFGEETRIGKTTIGDIREGKRTYLVQCAFEQATPRDQATLDALVGKADITVAEADTVRSIIVESDAKQTVENLINEYIKTCRDIIDTMAASGIRADGFERLIQISTKRDK